MSNASRSRVRVVALASASALLLTLVGPARAADPRPPTTNRAKAAAGWLASQLVDGDHLITSFGGTDYDDPGLTADAIVAFAAAHVAGAAGERATDWLAEPANLSNYIGDGSSAIWAGATAKTALVAETQGLNPRAFGGVNLLARLISVLADSGRFSDMSPYGDFSNSIGQSLAVIAFVRADGKAPYRAVAFLKRAQCDDGGTPQNFGGTCTSSVDATAFAVQAMLASGRTDAANAGLDWLGSQQQANGGFGSPANANSTGLAAEALRAGGRDAAADKAAAFLKTLQVGCGGAVANRGAIKYTAGPFDESTAPRATAQAILGLTGVGLRSVSNATSTPESASLACA